MKFSLIRRQVKKSYTITFEGGFGGQLSSACAYAIKYYTNLF
jgi:hypothetical protein